jgi:FAD synthetase
MVAKKSMKQESNSSETFHLLLKHFLKVAYLLSHKKGSFSVIDFSNILNRTSDEGKSLLSVLKGLNMVNTVSQPSDHYKITSGGKNNLKIVLTGGVFDIVHLGHINTLKEAKNLGDILIVVIASDKTVEISKGRPPLNTQDNRVELLSYLKIVDLVVKGDPDPQKFLESVIQYSPDIIAIGNDQSLTEAELINQLSDKELDDIEVIRLNTKIPNEKSSIKLKGLDKHSFD